MHERAGTLVLPEDLINIEEALSVYYGIEPNPSIIDQRVSFGASRHRGLSLNGKLNETHIVVITAAIVEYRVSQGIDGPLFIGRDTHVLSEPAWCTTLKTLAVAGVSMKINSHSSYAPTPAVSATILGANGASQALRASGPGPADGIIVTPSHNPPCNGGFKYDPPHGKPADMNATGWIAGRASKILREGWHKIPYIVGASLFEDEHLEKFDCLTYYVGQLDQVIDIDTTREAGVRIGVGPLGGTSVDCWTAIAEHYGLEPTVMNPVVDPV